MNSFQKKKQLTGYYSKNKKNESNRSASYTKRNSNTMATPNQRCSSGSAKRKKPKESPKSTINGQLYGYGSTTASSKFLGGKSLNKYASVDHLYDAKKVAGKPTLKVKASKITAKGSKNSSVDNLFQRNLLDSDLKYSYKGLPSNLKVKKDRNKLKKKKSKKDIGYLNKQLGVPGERKAGSQEPLSINIVNTNHLHLSGYNNAAKSNASAQNHSIDSEKKENFQSIIQSFKPNQTNKNAPVSGVARIEDKKRSLKQEIKTTRPKKSAKKSASKLLNCTKSKFMNSSIAEIIS